VRVYLEQFRIRLAHPPVNRIFDVRSPRLINIFAVSGMKGLLLRGFGRSCFSSSINTIWLVFVLFSSSCLNELLIPNASVMQEQVLAESTSFTYRSSTSPWRGLKTEVVPDGISSILIGVCCSNCGTQSTISLHRLAPIVASSHPDLYLSAPVSNKLPGYIGVAHPVANVRLSAESAQ